METTEDKVVTQETTTETPAVQTTEPQQTNTLVDTVDNLSANYNVSTEEAMDSLNRTALQTDAQAYTTELANIESSTETNATCLNDYVGAGTATTGETATGATSDYSFDIVKPEDITTNENGIYDLSSIYQKRVEALQESTEAQLELQKKQFEDNLAAMQQQAALGISCASYKFSWGNETLNTGSSGYSNWYSGYHRYSGRSYYRRWRNYGWKNYRRWSNWKNYGYSKYEDPYLEGLNEDESTALWGLKALYGESEKYEGVDWDEAAHLLSMGDYDLEEASYLLTKWHGAVVQNYRANHVDKEFGNSPLSVMNARREAGIEAPHIRTMEDYDNEQKEKWKGYTTNTPIYDKISETLVPMAKYVGTNAVEEIKKQDAKTNASQAFSLFNMLANPASALASTLGTTLGSTFMEKEEKKVKANSAKNKKQKEKDYNIKKEQAAAKKAMMAAKEKVKKDTTTTSSGKKTTSRAAMYQMSQARNKADKANKKAAKNAKNKKNKSSKKKGSNKSSKKKK